MQEEKVVTLSSLMNFFRTWERLRGRLSHRCFRNSCSVCHHTERTSIRHRAPTSIIRSVTTTYHHFRSSLGTAREAQENIHRLLPSFSNHVLTSTFSVLSLILKPTTLNHRKNHTFTSTVLVRRGDKSRSKTHHYLHHPASIHPHNPRNKESRQPKKMPKTILILGGSGRVALCLTRLLTTRGDTVHSLIRNPSQSQTLISLGAKPVVQSLEESSVDDLAETFIRIRPDVVVSHHVIQPNLHRQ